ncbi:hypothetical protein [Meiothermus hypogaeus]|uniref:Uncharacterized protein n=2 Tax=Meiothermus hypogaeus TaxID=884155 RepID=A0A511R4U2_9DEIN|nr:hypothetical protein [Meiothermus hypogaeus]RIH76685.1 hypothetical protein Mhypo_02365 [Meiothermus hypogaeus]GEM83912.1 hypothetical protein MHY01S_20780 [Meiothermus hypogaeus NBRC 106114]
MAIRIEKDKKTLGPMSIEKLYWDELWQEIANLQTMYRQAQQGEDEKTKQAIVDSITHLIGHLKVILEDGR